ncbi:MAG: glycosyltransferase family 2 protein, partial [Prochlorothrix sp.]
MIYLLTVSYYGAEYLRILIPTLPIDAPLIIINNAPSDRDLEALGTDFGDRSLHIFNAYQNLGFGQGCNLGLQYLYDRDPHALVWLINPDTYSRSLNLQTLQHLFQQSPHLSILGTTVYTPDDRLWFGGGEFIARWGQIHEADYRDRLQSQDWVTCDWVTGCSLVINLANFTTCPQFDPAYFLYYEDFDFCQRYRHQGHTIAITDRLSLYHRPSSITDRTPRSKLRHSTYSHLLTLPRYAPLPLL